MQERTFSTRLISIAMALILAIGLMPLPHVGQAVADDDLTAGQSSIFAAQDEGVADGDSAADEVTADEVTPDADAADEVTADEAAADEGAADADAAATFTTQVPASNIKSISASVSSLDFTYLKDCKFCGKEHVDRALFDITIETVDGSILSEWPGEEYAHIIVNGVDTECAGGRVLSAKGDNVWRARFYPDDNSDNIIDCEAILGSLPTNFSIRFSVGDDASKYVDIPVTFTAVEQEATFVKNAEAYIDSARIGKTGVVYWPDGLSPKYLMVTAEPQIYGDILMGSYDISSGYAKLMHNAGGECSGWLNDCCIVQNKQAFTVTSSDTEKLALDITNYNNSLGYENYKVVVKGETGTKASGATPVTLTLNDLIGNTNVTTNVYIYSFAEEAKANYSVKQSSAQKTLGNTFDLNDYMQGTAANTDFVCTSSNSSVVEIAKGPAERTYMSATAKGVGTATISFNVRNYDGSLTNFGSMAVTVSDPSEASALSTATGASVPGSIWASEDGKTLPSQAETLSITPKKPEGAVLSSIN